MSVIDENGEMVSWPYELPDSPQATRWGEFQGAKTREGAIERARGFASLIKQPLRLYERKGGQYTLIYDTATDKKPLPDLTAAWNNRTFDQYGQAHFGN